jgi:transcriptional regulator with XRE-family HTH domain
VKKHVDISQYVNEVTWMECLKEFRKEKGLTTKEMTDVLGISLSLYEKVEYSNRRPSREFLSKFKKVFPSFDMNIFFDEMLYEMCS